ncbi:LysR family transcriptional regulator [Undibacterium pigrum]|uniref:DNA-binding transcriptional LysR family regulator n=1 Tax=Undibacterium pigrum TaxID=401470 RepID=A0A318J7V4_9BURK|nr:LysR family transcriptional regulator [Undibacterium pigrum]PXX43223.1 DNA-binding transcriptional LysR family regulator [Undibacterium pigrum]
MSTPPDLNDLYYFAQVVDHRGFAPAGRAIGIPKSKLSRRIAELEERLGVRLIQRSSRSFSVTEIGQTYYSHCKAMLAEASAAQEAIDQDKAEPQGVIRLSCPIAMLHAQVGTILAEYMVSHPRVTLQLEASNRRVDVIAEGFDLAIRVRPPPLEDSELVVKVLGTRCWCLAASPALLEKLGTPQQPADLANYPSLDLGPAREEYLWQLVGEQGELLTMRHTPRMISDDMTALRQAAIAGAGVVTLPVMMMEEELKDGRLVQLIPYWTLKHGIVHLVFPSRRWIRPAVRSLIDMLDEKFKDLPNN